CEPCRHYQIVGRQLQVPLARRFDEFQILVGELQHRDLGDVDLLVARESQEKVERALEAVDSDDECLVHARDGFERVKYLRIFGHAARSRSSLTRASAAAGSKGAGARNWPSTNCVRFSAAPSNGLASFATSRISSRLPLQ